MDDNTTLLKKGLGRQVPPQIEDVKIYFIQKGMGEADAIYFFNHFARCNWTNLNGRLIKNWKTLACDWVWELALR